MVSIKKTTSPHIIDFIIFAINNKIIHFSSLNEPKKITHLAFYNDITDKKRRQSFFAFMI